MEILLKTKDVSDIIDFIQCRLEDEFFSLIGMYECSISEMDYWIKAQIIERLGDSTIHLTQDRFFEPGGNLINDDICIFIRDIDVDDYEYIIVENEPYVDQNPELRDYSEWWGDFDQAFENFKTWAFNYINKVH